MKFLKSLEKQQHTWYVIGFSVLFFILRFPSFFEPLWNIDSSIYSIVAMSIRHGRLLYSDIWDNKPPLIYYLYGIFSGDIGGVHLLSFIVGLITIWLFYLLATAVTKKHISLWLTGLFTIFLGTPIFAANTANAENFILPLLLCASILFIKILHVFPHSASPKTVFLLGFILGIAAMIKTVVVCDFLAFIFVYKTLHSLRTVKDLKKVCLVSWPMIFGFLVPFIFFCFYFFVRGTIQLFISTIFVSYIAPMTNMLFLYGFLILRSILFIALGLLLYKNRDRLGKIYYFLSFWLLTSLFEGLLPERGFSHYILLILPSMLLVGGVIWEKFFTSKRRTVFAFIFGCFLLMFYFHPNWFFGNYYQNFLSFMTGQRTMEQYAAHFDPTVPTDYAVASFLKSRMQPEDKVVIWGDKPQMYILLQKIPAGKLTTVYHTWFMKNSLEEEGKAFANTSPRFVVIYPDQIAIPYSLSTYTNAFMIHGVTVYEKNNTHITK